MPPKSAPVHRLGRRDAPNKRTLAAARPARRARKPREGPDEAPIDVRPARVLALPRNRRASGRGSGGSPANPASAMMKNAELYVAQLLAPFDHCGHRVPDLLSYPTATVKLRELVEIKTDIAESVMFTLQPYPINSSDAQCFSAKRTSAAGVFGSWTRVASARAATFGNFYQFRTAAFGARLLPSSALQNRSGIITCGRFHERGDMPTAVGGMSSNPTATTVAATGSGGGCFQAWRPSTYEAGLEFNPPVLDTSIPPEPILYWEFGPTPDGAQTYSVEVVWHIEFIPKQANAPLFETASAPGSASDVANAYMRAESGAGDIDQQAGADFSDRLAAAASRVADSHIGRAVGTALGQKAAQYLTRTLGAYPGSTPMELLARARGGGAASAASAASTRPVASDDDEVVIVRRTTRTM